MRKFGEMLLSDRFLRSPQSLALVEKGSSDTNMCMVFIVTQRQQFRIHTRAIVAILYATISRMTNKMDKQTSHSIMLWEVVFVRADLRE